MICWGRPSYHMRIRTSVFALIIMDNLSSSASAQNIITTRWNNIGAIQQVMVPPLSPNNYKGEMGRIGIIGGSKDYTGAPFYAGQSSLKAGADLVFIFCAEEAAIPIKSYSPELMVTSFYSNADLAIKDSEAMDKLSTARAYEVKRFFPRLHSLVGIPTLCPVVQKYINFTTTLK